MLPGNLARDTYYRMPFVKNDGLFALLTKDYRKARRWQRQGYRVYKCVLSKNPITVLWSLKLDRMKLRK